MSFVKKVAFPIKAQSIPLIDEEEAICSSRGEDESSILREKVHNEEQAATPLSHSLEPIKEKKDDNLDMISTDLLKQVMGELDQMRRKHEDLERKVQLQNDEMEEMRRQNEDLKQRLPEEMERLIRTYANGPQQGSVETDSRPSGDRTNLLHRSSSTIVRSTLGIDADSEQHFFLPKDTFSLRMVSNPRSSTWSLGIKITLFILLCVEMFTKKGNAILT